ncbi:gag-pol polyprotein [Moniliophthora roreri]|nr:gag-pol polyprotein [Moniliophthora roreri]
MQVGSLSSSHEIWLALKQVGEQKGSGMLMYWMQHLITPLSSGSDIEEHLKSFQECLSMLKKLDFDVPSYLEAALLLATLSANPKDSQSWYSFIHAQSVNKETKLSDIVSSIVDLLLNLLWQPWRGMLERRADTSAQIVEKSHCTKPGGGRAGKKNKKKGKGGKSKEKAYAAEDSGGEEVSNVVLADLDLALNDASFHYDASTVNSPSTHSHSTASDEAYLASMSSGSKFFIIDSGSSTHLHSSRSDFATYSATPGVITGVGQGKLPIMGRGEAHIPAKSKAGHSSKVKLKHMAFVPDASASLISVARMDEDGCYTIFGNGKSLCFQLNDSGELLCHLSASENSVNKKTKLSDIISSMCEATHADATIAPQSGSAVESALATLERDARGRFYCTEPGGGRAGKKNKKKKRKGSKKKVYAAENGGEGGVFNIVLTDLDLALNNASFHYDTSIVNSPSIHSHSTASDEVYLASTSSGSKSFIIDSSSSTHLHSSHTDFASYSATPSVITGVGQGKLPIVG